MKADVEAAKNFIRAHAGARYPYECCGLIVGKGEKQEVICGRNIALDPRHTFMLHPEDYGVAEDTGEILAIYHSHCDEPPVPSEADKTLAEKQEVPVVIVGWPADQWEVYTPCGWRANFEGRPFVFGVLDCLTLIQDWFKEKHSIIIPNFIYTPEFYKTQDLYRENLPKHGFVRVDDVQTDDLLLMQLTDGFPNHVAIYTGDGMMLHHPPDHLSGYHPYVYNQGFYATRTVGVYRHKQLMK